MSARTPAASAALVAAFFVLTAWIALVPRPVLGADAASSSTISSLQQFFKGQDSKSAAPMIDFEVTGGFADIATGNAESTGRYFLAASHITRLTGDIYRMDLAFAKQLVRDIMDFSPGYYFTEDRTYFFWYNNGDRIVFKVGSSPVAIPITRKDISRVDIQSRDTYSVDRQRLTKALSLVDGNAVVNLQIRFK